MKAIEMRNEGEKQADRQCTDRREQVQSVGINWYESEGFKIWLKLAGHQRERE